MTPDAAVRLDRPARPGHTGAMLAINRRKSAFLAAAIAVTMLAARDSAAQSTDWYETMGGVVRIVVAPPQPADTEIRAMLEIRLEEGWKTYWRDPGASGIPPQIDVSGSKGVANARLHYPVPVWIDNPYGDFAGYDAPVALPVTMTRTANGKADLVANVFLGICEDICIPVQTQFTMRIGNATGSTLAAMRVEQAHAALPPPDADGLSVMEDGHTADGDARILVVDATNADAAPQLFVHALDGTQFKPPKLLSSDRGTAIFALAPVDPPNAPRTVDAIVTVGGGAVSIETVLSLTLD
ncbi:MAG: protein-disulfide reductase DsbD family protein [Phyllobacteriaceae bacterium]|nr:protein-disulfide reductase DsbD family protein [Phyllobacteriaceae bacterium]